MPSLVNPADTQAAPPAERGGQPQLHPFPSAAWLPTWCHLTGAAPPRAKHAGLSLQACLLKRKRVAGRTKSEWTAVQGSNPRDGGGGRQRRRQVRQCARCSPATPASAQVGPRSLRRLLYLLHGEGAALQHLSLASLEADASLHAEGGQRRDPAEVRGLAGRAPGALLSVCATLAYLPCAVASRGQGSSGKRARGEENVALQRRVLAQGNGEVASERRIGRRQMCTSALR